MKRKPDWLVVRLIAPVTGYLAKLLDAGGSEAIQLALDLRSDFILVDEKREGEKRGVQCRASDLVR